MVGRVARGQQIQGRSLIVLSQIIESVVGSVNLFSLRKSKVMLNLEYLESLFGKNSVE